MSTSTDATVGSSGELRPTKRRRTGGSMARRFLDLEASAEVGDDDKDDDGDGDLGNFFDDRVDPDQGDDEGDEYPIDETPNADEEGEDQRARSQAADQAWANFLRRARDRARSRVPPTSFPLQLDGSSVLDPDRSLWEVGVKLGSERATATRLTNRLLESGSTTNSLRVRGTYPGRVLVEAAHEKDVLHHVSGVHGFRKSVKPLSPESTLQLMQTGFFTTGPKRLDWVRMRKGVYKNDIGIIINVSPNHLVDIVVVPRIDYSTGVKGKGNASVAVRLPQARFDAEKAKNHNKKSLRTFPDHYVYNRRKYRLDGYYILKGKDESWFKIELGALAPHEPMLFAECQDITRQILRSALDKISISALKLEDRVMVMFGPLKGEIGTIKSISNNNTEAEVHLVEQNVITPIETFLLRKDLRIGDEVRVVSGEHRDFIGWITEVLALNATVFSHRNMQEVEVRLAQLEFHSADFIGVSHAPPLHLDTSAMKDDIGAEYIGRQVRIIRGTEFKNYSGLIKQSYQNGDFLVELEPTRRKERIPLKNLAFRHGLGIMPIVSTDAPTGSIQGPSHFPIPASSKPLVPSTPLPPALTGYVSPAWDPSSRTPGGPRRHLIWLYDPIFEGKPIVFRIQNTKPVLRDPGFRNGAFEGKQAAFKHIADEIDSVVVRVGMEAVNVPIKYLQVWAPEMKGEIVIVIDGEHCGEEYIVLTISDGVCGLWPRKVAGRRKVTVTIPITRLCKIF